LKLERVIAMPTHQLDVRRAGRRPPERSRSRRRSRRPAARTRGPTTSSPHTHVVKSPPGRFVTPCRPLSIDPPEMQPGGVPVLCTIGKANDRVVEDIQVQLGAELVTQRGPLS
jgi:hypothetical protein